jgi:hypothetical protein
MNKVTAVHIECRDKLESFHKSVDNLRWPEMKTYNPLECSSCHPDVESFRVEEGVGYVNSEWFSNQFGSQPLINLKVHGESNGRSLMNKGNGERM